MDDLLKEFLVESGENLARLDRDVVELERDPSNTALLNSVFRTVHTIKGTCGFLGLVRLERVSHAAESVLERLRSGVLAASPDVITDILAAIDVVKEILRALARTGTEPDGDDTRVMAALDAWLTPAPVEAARQPDPAARGGADPRPGGSDHPAAEPARDARSTADTLRVGVGVLDALMKLAGELVLARNQLLQISARDDESPYAAPLQQLHRITAELQDAVMKTRMQPVGAAWGKLPRLVRDIARETGKRIELDMKGAATELDRQLVQALQDPLTHMLRNSADHGIELPATRRAAGKPETGNITLAAYHEGGQVIVEVRDDGAGIDPERVRRSAIARGLVRPDAAPALSDQQVLRFILEPGFSTADAVTHLSGRGVGMDVVSSNVERVGGTIDVHSAPGVGTTVRIRLPLTLAIVPALLVRAGGEDFAIPQGAVLELVRVSDDPASGTRFDVLHGVRLLRLRGALIPVVDLAALLELGQPALARSGDVVVCRLGEARVAIAVGDVLDAREIVVKPAGRRARQLGCYAGCTILGDGRIIMILDLAGIVARAGIRTVAPADTAPEAVGATAQAARERLLLFDAGSDTIQAVPLSLVARLEEIPVERIGQADGRHVVQYRGGLLPLVPAGAGVTVTAGRSRSVIVFNDGPTSFGLAVNAISDIVEDTLTIDLAPNRPDVLGTAVIAGRTVEVIDAAYFHARSRRGRPVS